MTVTPSNRRSIQARIVFVLLILMALPAIMAVYLAAQTGMGETISPGGQNPNPSPEQRGQTQEDAVRDAIQREGYEQPFGTTDAEIRTNLSVQGKTADMVGYHPAQDRWLIAESKGGDIRTAYDQLENTMDALLKRNPSIPSSKVELKIYTNAEQFRKMTQGDLAGWRVDENKYLGWRDIDEVWHYAELKGNRILVQVAPVP
jgi:hypothetical protein